MITESTGLMEAVGECWKYWEIDLGVRGGYIVRNTEDLDNRK